MADILTMILLLVACFTAAILNLAVDSGFRRKMTGGFIAAALTIGILSYGYGYARVQGLNFTSLIRALLAVCRMFVGVNDLGSIQEAPLFSRPAVQALFWTGHFMAYYVMASTAIAAVGERLMRRIRTTLLRRGPLLLIYGISADSVAYGRRMAQEKRVSVLYVDEDYNQVFDSAIKAFGGVVEKSSSALEANERFLRQIGFKPGKRRLELAALDPDGRKNLEYARALLDAMNARGIRPEQTSLIAAGAGESASALQTLKEAGYGSVYAFDEYELTARMMIREHPPCGLISFDENGKAEEDFHAVLLGFGRMGRAVLNQLILNGQFHGSRFQVDVFDPDAQNGYLHDQPMMREYDIRFHRISGAAEEFYAFWEEHLKEIRMIVLCTGDQRKNQELAEDLFRWYPWDEKLPLILYAAGGRFCRMTEDGQEEQSPSFLESPDLDPELTDAVAMQVNQTYCQEAGSRDSAAENWRRCTYFNRQSSRASADFYPAMLRAAGKTVDQVLAGDWPPQGEMLENLSRTEHLRWCAFQYVAGYAPMPREVWEDRAETFRGGAEKGFRIGKDPKKRLQACLIPWEELDDLSDRENAVTGGQVDYKQLDRNNVLQLARVLRAWNKEEKKA